jgi:hypothetical protein
MVDKSKTGDTRLCFTKKQKKNEFYEAPDEGIACQNIYI